MSFCSHRCALVFTPQVAYVILCICCMYYHQPDAHSSVDWPSNKRMVPLQIKTCTLTNLQERPGESTTMRRSLSSSRTSWLPSHQKTGCTSMAFTTAKAMLRQRGCMDSQPKRAVTKTMLELKLLHNRLTDQALSPISQKPALARRARARP